MGGHEGQLYQLARRFRSSPTIAEVKSRSDNPIATRMECDLDVPGNGLQVGKLRFSVDRVEQSHDRDSGIGKFRAYLL